MVLVLPHIHHFSLFIAASLALIVVPGPDSIYVISRSIAQGRQAGLLSSWGTSTGAFMHTIAAALGLSAILATSAYAFTMVKSIGAIYLIYLGVKTFFAQTHLGELEINQEKDTSSWAIFGQGILVDLLNPKSAIFFLAFLPQFIDPAIPSKAVTFVSLGTSFIFMALAWDLILIMSSTSIAHHLHQNGSLGRQLNRLTGIVFIGLGLRLATEKL
ncbi:MAG: LysE family translocator [Cyanophyceae cyanobacterium]